MVPSDPEAILAQADAQGKPDDPALVKEVLTNLRAVIKLIYASDFNMSHEKAL